MNDFEQAKCLRRQWVMEQIERHSDNDGMATVGALIAVLATCALSLSLILTTASSFPSPVVEFVHPLSPGNNAVASAPYFPAQYKLDAPDEVPRHIDSF